MSNNGLATLERQEIIMAPQNPIANMAEAFCKSGMFEDIKDAAQAFVKIQAGKELGLEPVYSMQNINMIKSKLTCNATTLALLVKRSGKYDYRVKQHDENSCVIVFFERGDVVGESSFSMDDAKRAGLTRNPTWTTYPKAMLFSRAISAGARVYCPDAIGGIYTAEEIDNIPAKYETVKLETISETAPMTDEEANEIFKPNRKPSDSQPDNDNGMLGYVDGTWLKETSSGLSSGKYAGMLNWLKGKGCVGESVEELVSQLNAEDAARFTKLLAAKAGK